MEDRLDSYFADSDSGDEAIDVVVEDYFEEEVAGWRPNDNDDGIDDDDQVLPTGCQVNSMRNCRSMHRPRDVSRHEMLLA